MRSPPLPPDPIELEALETRHAQPHGRLARGKLCEVFEGPQRRARVVSKRLPPLTEAARWERGVEVYQERLALAGVSPLPCALGWLERPEGLVGWAVQRAVEPSRLATVALRHAGRARALALFESVLEHVASACDGALGVDAQLDNWGLFEGDLVYLDTAVPLLRDPGEEPLPDLAPFLHDLPVLARPLARPMVRVALDRFFEPRAALLELLARLPEQHLDRWTRPFTELVNLLVEPSITTAELEGTQARLAMTRGRLAMLRRWRRRSGS